MKPTAPDRLTERGVLGELRQLCVERCVAGSKHVLHGQVDDRGHDDELAEQGARCLDTGGLRWAERPVDALVADSRGHPCLLRPADIARNGPWR